MSFSSNVKNEICRYTDMTKDEARAELSAIMKASGTLSIIGNGKISFRVSSENSFIARLVFTLLKKYFNIHAKLMAKRSNSLKKNNLYVVQITEDMGVRELLRSVYVLEDRDMLALSYVIQPTIVNDDNCRRAYLRGAFLGGGSISNPEKTYHLEFVTHNLEYAKELSSLVNLYGLNSKVIGRKNSFIIYLKEGEHIIDALNIIGAHNSLLELENVRILKEMRNNVNRLVNCETANLSKTVNAAVRQAECIKLIQKEIGLQRLPKNLRDIAEIRLAFPDETLKELGQMLTPPVGKSGVNHRLRKIEKIAEEFTREER